MKIYFKIILISFAMLFSASLKAQHKIGLVIHGGAGNISRENLGPEAEKAYRHKLQEALQAGWNILENGGSSIDAVTEAIQILEESPLFNAGRGAVLTHDGKNELDASVMNGRTGQAGAVAGVSTIKSPILAAKAVMENSPHVMLSGRGVEQFAKEQGLEIVDSSYFFDKRRLEQLKKFRKTEEDRKKEEGSLQYIPGNPLLLNPDQKFGTVGAVALDKDGNLAAGTSTGGMLNKQFGRIGDSPVIGAGTYANNATCAVSATGHGEFFIRNVVAYDISALMEYRNLSVKEASYEVIMTKLQKKGGEGGVIAMDRNGNIAMPFNTTGMFRGFIQKNNEPQVSVFP